MSGFMGLVGLDLSGVAVKSGQSILDVGLHDVKIMDAKVVRNDTKKMAQLEVSYANDDGKITQWIIVYYEGHNQAVEIGHRQVKEILLAMGHDGNEFPEFDVLKGKNVSIRVGTETYNGNTNKRVKYVNPPRGKQAEGDDADAAKPLDDEIPF